MIEFEAIEQGQARLGSFELGHGDGPVQLDDRGAGLADRRVVERGDLLPVAWLMEVQVGDGRRPAVPARPPALGTSSADCS